MSSSFHTLIRLAWEKEICLHSYRFGNVHKQMLKRLFQSYKMFRFWIFSKDSSNDYCELNSCFICDSHFSSGLCILLSGVFEATMYLDVSKQFSCNSCSSQLQFLIRNLHLLPKRKKENGYYLEPESKSCTHNQ